MGNRFHVTLRIVSPIILRCLLVTPTNLGKPNVARIAKVSPGIFYCIGFHMHLHHRYDWLRFQLDMFDLIINPYQLFLPLK